MCGITGIWDRSLSHGELRSVASAMSAKLHHRGPDDAGVWIDGESNIALGHRRLAIVDLSAAGHQPMVSPGGRYVMTYNGEVYNYRELRHDLENRGYRFVGRSDTEAILSAFEKWGVEGAVRKFIGMFSLGLWDRREQVLHLVRDRLGIKPLYFGWAGDALVFGSELKALREHPRFIGVLDETAVRSFLCYGYVPAPLSIYRQIFKLPPGCILSVAREQMEHPERLSPFPERTDCPARPRRYWSAREVVERGAAQKHELSEGDACERLEVLLRDAMRMRMLADVPVGAFFSGGVDSSLVVALMQAEGGRAVRTFTVSYDDDACDEGDYAAAVARHLETEHADLRVSASAAMGIIPRLPTIADEPNADAALIPTLLVSELASGSVKVCLSGEGGDELFGGYHRYFYLRRLERFMPPLRRAAALMLKTIPPTAWHIILDNAGVLFADGLRARLTADKPYRLGAMMRPRSARELLIGQISHWNGRPSASDPRAEGEAVLYPAAWADLPELSLQSMYFDSMSYLPDCLLAKLDRTTMAVGLEGRVPLLDHRVFEFAWELPIEMRLQATGRKRLLRRILQKYVPRALIDRPKHGFAVPIGAWISGPLRDWTENLLDERRLAECGYYDSREIRRMWTNHLRGCGSWTFYLWPILVLQAWKEQWL